MSWLTTFPGREGFKRKKLGNNEPVEEDDKDNPELVKQLIEWMTRESVGPTFYVILSLYCNQTTKFYNIPYHVELSSVARFL